MILMPTNSHLFIEAVTFLTDPVFKEKIINKLESLSPQTIIIDNSTHVLGSPLTASHLYRVYTALPSHHCIYLVAPDYLGNFKKTKEESILFNNELKGRGLEIMGVCQGISQTEYLECHNHFLSLEFSAVGFPFKQHYTDSWSSSGKFSSNRLILIDYLVNERVISPGIYYHLFGLNYLEEILLYKDPKYDFIKSVDSSKIKEEIFL